MPYFSRSFCAFLQRHVVRLVRSAASTAVHTVLCESIAAALVEWCQHKTSCFEADWMLQGRKVVVADLVGRHVCPTCLSMLTDYRSRETKVVLSDEHGSKTADLCVACRRIPRDRRRILDAKTSDAVSHWRSYSALRRPSWNGNARGSVAGGPRRLFAVFGTGRAVPIDPGLFCRFCWIGLSFSFDVRCRSTMVHDATFAVKRERPATNQHEENKETEVAIRKIDHHHTAVSRKRKSHVVDHLDVEKHGGRKKTGLVDVHPRKETKRQAHYEPASMVRFGLEML